MTADLDARDAKALTEYLTVLEDVGRARGAPDLYLVVSGSGREYLVDAHEGCCECDDSFFRHPAGGCKHVRRVAFATGARAIPTWVDRDAVDPLLGRHVSGGPVFAGDAETGAGDDAAAGNDDPRGEAPADEERALVVAGDGAEVLDEGSA